MANPGTLMLIGTAISAGATIYSGRQQAAAEKERRRMMEQEAQTASIRAQDDEIQRRRELALQLGEGAAIGAQGGFDPFAAGSSFLALREETEEQASADVDMIRLLGASDQARIESMMRQSKMAGDAAKTGSYLQAGATLASGYGKYKSTKTPSGYNTIGAPGNWFGPKRS